MDSGDLRRLDDGVTIRGQNGPPSEGAGTKERIHRSGCTDSLNVREDTASRRIGSGHPEEGGPLPEPEAEHDAAPVLGIPYEDATVSGRFDTLSPLAP